MSLLLLSHALLLPVAIVTGSALAHAQSSRTASICFGCRTSSRAFGEPWCARRCFTSTTRRPEQGTGVLCCLASGRLYSAVRTAVLSADWPEHGHKPGTYKHCQGMASRSELGVAAATCQAHSHSSSHSA